MAGKEGGKLVKHHRTTRAQVEGMNGSYPLAEGTRGTPRCLGGESPSDFTANAEVNNRILFV